MNLLKSPIILIAILAIGIVPIGNAKENNLAVKKILILGLENNIQSDYYYRELISEESGIPLENLDQVFNQTVAENISESHMDFISVHEDANCSEIIKKISVKGEEYNCTSDLSSVDNQCYSELLSRSGADYLLILNRHYLKKQEEPFNTLFYFVSYSLYNKEKKEVLNGSDYFTAMHVESEKIMKKASRKSSDKIAASVLKTVSHLTSKSSALLLSKN